MRAVLYAPWDEDGYPTLRVECSPEEMARLKQRGGQLGYEVREERATSFKAAWKFLDQIGSVRP